ncbi:hypothetical protein CASFOL_030819 [Castilleja foliolosa]|uniref:TFIIS N-terminal domain-containing protein n=1 Tax=Castilleja foliolosa TaxID=1961234 RepID=A0ABD3C6D8_9LAMI
MAERMNRKWSLLSFVSNPSHNLRYSGMRGSAMLKCLDRLRKLYLLYSNSHPNLYAMMLVRGIPDFIGSGLLRNFTEDMRMNFDYVKKLIIESIYIRDLYGIGDALLYRNVSDLLKYEYQDIVSDLLKYEYQPDDEFKEAFSNMRGETTPPVDFEGVIAGETILYEEWIMLPGGLIPCGKIKPLKRKTKASCSIYLYRFQVTKIGISVNAWRKHEAKEIRNLVRKLIENWTNMIDSWVEATEAVEGAEIRTDSVKTSVMEQEEEGLPSPPLDEGAFLADPTSIELSENRENGGNKPNVEKTEVRKIKNESLKYSHPPLMPEQKNNLEPMLKKQTLRSQTSFQQKPDDKVVIPKKPMPPRQEKLNFNNEPCDGIRLLEAAKRKLHERYQEVENDQ